MGIQATNVKDHQNHFHVVVQPPELKSIDGGASNLLADDTVLKLSGIELDQSNQAEAVMSLWKPIIDQNLVGELTMFIPDMPPEFPQQDVPVMMAETANKKSGLRVIGQCAPIGTGESGILFQPERTASLYFKWFEDKEIGIEGNTTLVNGPEHGTLNNYTKGKWEYTLTEGYLGLDNVTFLVEIDGYRVKLIYGVNSVDYNASGGTEGYDPLEDPRFCPNGFFWKITPDGKPVPLKRIDLGSIETWTHDSRGQTR